MIGKNVLDGLPPDVAGALRRMERGDMNESLAWLRLVNEPLHTAVIMELRRTVKVEGALQLHLDGLMQLRHLALAIQAVLPLVIESGMAVALAEPEMTMPLSGQVADLVAALTEWSEVIGRRRGEARLSPDEARPDHVTT